MKNNILIIVVAISLIIYGFATNTHPYDYIASGIGGYMLGWGIEWKINFKKL